jgi:transposase
LCCDTVTESQQQGRVSPWSSHEPASDVIALIETTKLNGVNPQAYLTDVLTRIADYPAKHVAELLPWNWQPANSVRAAA